MSAKHSFEGADLSIDGPPKFDLGAVVEDPAVVKNGGDAPISDFQEDPKNTRIDYVESELQMLIESIRREGVMQPLHVLKQDSGKLLIVSGHRRFRAAQAAGLTHLPWILARESHLSLVARLQENAVREDIQPMDKAKAIHELMDTGLNRKEVAERIGLDRRRLAHDGDIRRQAGQGQTKGEVAAFADEPLAADGQAEPAANVGDELRGRLGAGRDIRDARVDAR